MTQKIIKKISVDGVSYNIDDLSSEALSSIEAIKYLEYREMELAQLCESLNISRTRNIEKLKEKIINIKTGLEF